MMTTIDDVMTIAYEMPGGFERARDALRATIEQYAAERVMAALAICAERNVIGEQQNG